MRPLVVDASAVAAWLVRSQQTVRSDEFLRGLDRFDCLAPDIFRWEIVNVLLAQSRRSTTFDVARALLELDEYRVRCDAPIGHEEIDGLARVALVESLSLFDTAYLATAINHEAELVSRDRALIAAALRHGVVVHDLND